MSSAGARGAPVASVQRSSTSKLRRCEAAAGCSGTIGCANSVKRRWSSASRTCNAERIDAVRTASSSPSREAATRRLPPYSFAAKHAASACESSPSKSTCGVALCAMPMLAAAVSIWSCQSMRRPSIAASTRRPQAIAADSVIGTSTANSSPPVRATSALSPNSPATTPATDGSCRRPRRGSPNR